MKIRTEMKPKDLWRRATLLRRLPQLSLKIEISRKRGSIRRGATLHVASSSTSILKDASGEPAAAKDSEIEMFELLDS
jgi:hypothetical protein